MCTRHIHARDGVGLASGQPDRTGADGDAGRVVPRVDCGPNHRAALRVDSGQEPILGCHPYNPCAERDPRALARKVSHSHYAVDRVEVSIYLLQAYAVVAMSGARHPERSGPGRQSGGQPADGDRPADAPLLRVDPGYGPVVHIRDPKRSRLSVEGERSRPRAYGQGFDDLVGVRVDLRDSVAVIRQRRDAARVLTAFEEARNGRGQAQRYDDNRCRGERTAGAAIAPRSPAVRRLSGRRPLLGRLNGGGGRPVERRVMREHGALQRSQLLARFDADLFDECLSRPLVGLKRLGLAAGAVEREHQLGA
jgi:hypothetical protein